MQVSTSSFRNGLKIEVDGEPYVIVEFLHVKPGKGGAFVRTKLKSMLSGRVVERTFRAGEKVELADVEEKEMQYLYTDGSHFYFMDTETYEQKGLTREQLGEAQDFLVENTKVAVLFFRSEPVGVELPNFVVLEVVDTEPGVKGDTVSGGSKPAKLETGAVIQVPLFINPGDRIRIDTRTREYIERV